jgi:MYXO-CTERM domain-containing protein
MTPAEAVVAGWALVAVAVLLLISLVRRRRG